MAITTPSSVTPTATGAKATPAGSWIAPVFFTGVVLVFLGERVLSTMTTPRVLSTTLGLGAVLAATLLRWMSAVRIGGERGRIERLLGVAQLVSILAIAIALASSSLGARWIGLDALASDARERWDTILLVAWATLLLCGLLPLLFAETALVPMRRAPQPESRRVYAAASAGLSVALSVAYLGLFVGSAHQWGVAADFAFFKTAKPSTSTLKIAASLKEPVRIVAFFPAVNEVKTEVDRYLREVARTSPKIKFEFVDRVLSPKLAREMRVAQDGSIVLTRGEVRQTINLSTELKNARTTLRNLDQEFQKNLMKLAREPRVAYLTTGHHELNDRALGGSEVDRERGVSGLRKLLEMQNYRTLDLGMPQGLANDVPADATVVMVLGPDEPFAPEEVASLKRYVERGGALLLALNSEALNDQDVSSEAARGKGATPPGAMTAPSASVVAPAPSNSNDKRDNDKRDKVGTSQGNSDAPTSAAPLGAVLARGGSGPNLDALVSLVGLKLEPSILANDKGDSVAFAGNKTDRSRIVTNRFGSHASVSTLSRHSAWVVLFGTGSLKKLDPNDKTIDFALRSTTSTFQDKNGNLEADANEPRASYDLAAAVTRKTPKGEQRSFVIADADLFSDLVLKNVPTNRFLLLDAVRWLGGEESLTGEVNSEEDVRIEHTKEKDVLWFYATILGVPMLVLGLGLVWARRSRGQGGSR